MAKATDINLTLQGSTDPILHRERWKRGIKNGRIEFEIEPNQNRGPADVAELYKEVGKWHPESSSESVKAFRKHYLQTVAKIPACFCGHAVIIRTVHKETSPNKGKKFYGCAFFPRGCGYTRYLDETAVKKMALYRRIKQARITKAEMRTGYKRGWFGNEEEESERRVRRKLEESGIRPDEFLEAKKLNLY